MLLVSGITYSYGMLIVVKNKRHILIAMERFSFAKQMKKGGVQQEVRFTEF